MASRPCSGFAGTAALARADPLHFGLRALDCVAQPSSAVQCLAPRARVRFTACHSERSEESEPSDSAYRQKSFGGESSRRDAARRGGRLTPVTMPLSPVAS